MDQEGRRRGQEGRTARRAGDRQGLAGSRFAGRRRAGRHQCGRGRHRRSRHGPGFGDRRRRRLRPLRPPPAKAAKAEAKAAPAAAAPAAASNIDITVPVMGESVAEGSMGKWLKKTGDAVKKDELLVEIETDKVAVEVSAPADGVLTIAADEGATVTPGQKIGSISGSGAAASAPAAAPAPPPLRPTPARPRFRAQERNPVARRPARGRREQSGSQVHRRHGTQGQYHQGRRHRRHRSGRPGSDRRRRRPSAPRAVGRAKSG
jgi:biotin carboxyl carrier protein